MKYVVYIIKNNINSKIYVGKTGANPPSKRWKQHLKISRNPSKYKAMPIHYAIAKYGEINFTFSIIKEFEDDNDCFRAEIFWIEHLKSHNDNYGYNLTLGGEGNFPTKTTREKMKQSALKNRFKQTSLTIDSVNEIKEMLLSGLFTQRSIAQKFNIRPHTVGLIAKGKIFKDLVGEMPIVNVAPGYLHRAGENNNQSKFTQNQAEHIRKEYKDGVKVKDLAIKYKCSRQLINRIIYNKSYK
jgi:group I intron endonuclease